MAENKGLMGSLGEAAKNNPALSRLRDEASDYLQARGQGLTKNLGSRLEDATSRLQEHTENGGILGRGAAEGAKSMAKGENPVAGAAKGAAGGLKDKVKEKIPGMGGGSGGAKATKATIITEEIDVGAPVSVVYNQWTQYQDFPDFMKKVEHAEQEDEEERPTVKFKAQVLWSHRSWEATIKEQVPDEKITWRSEGEKGYVDGTVTFHELAPRLTRVIVVLEYYPQGFMERTGNIWRAQGRRARLELKHFRRHVMMNAMHAPEELEGWRGVVRDEEVERSHDEVVEDEKEDQESEDEGYEEEPEGEEAEYDEPEAEEGEYDEGEEEPEEYEDAEGEYDEEPEDEDAEGEYDEEPEDEEAEEEYEEEPEAEEEEYEEEPEEEEPPPRRRRRR
ncbi:MAG: SRPBCC family protein [Actinomycetota bacterium]|nr:SRPBCC family protein [Actinomycetota bacterium]